MHEIGQGITGWNTHHGPTRNPYNTSHFPGGSSSGSAALVASGLCPVAIGCDGGGSIRIPSALCGVYGLVRHARVPAPLCPFKPLAQLKTLMRGWSFLYAIRCCAMPRLLSRPTAHSPILPSIHHSDLATAVSPVPLPSHSVPTSSLLPPSFPQLFLAELPSWLLAYPPPPPPSTRSLRVRTHPPTPLAGLPPSLPGCLPSPVPRCIRPLLLASLNLRLHFPSFFHMVPFFLQPLCQMPTFARTREEHKGPKSTGTVGSTGPIAGDAQPLLRAKGKNLRHCPLPTVSLATPCPSSPRAHVIRPPLQLPFLSPVLHVPHCRGLWHQTIPPLLIALPYAGVCLINVPFRSQS